MKAILGNSAEDEEGVPGSPWIRDPFSCNLEGGSMGRGSDGHAESCMVGNPPVEP